MFVHRIRVGHLTRTFLGALLALGLATFLLSPIPASAAAPASPAAASPPAAEDPEGGYGRLLLLMDASGSMKESAGGGQTKIQAAKKALTTVVNALPDDAEVGLRVFGATEVGTANPKACGDTQLVVAPGTDNRSDLLQAIKGYEPFGETPIPIALKKAAQDLGDEGARSIVLVSDGESTCQPDACDVAANLADKGIDLQIDVVGLSVSGEARKQLKCIADQGHGTYYDAKDAGDIEKRLTRVAQRALRPFTLIGEDIAGGTESSPTAVTVGDWVDQLAPANRPESSRTYVFTRTVPGTTLRASAVSQGKLGQDGLRITITGPEGERCDISTTLRQIDSRTVIGVQAVAGVENSCDQPGDYLITVERRIGDKKTVPFGLRVAEEPVLADPGFVPNDDRPQVVEPEVSGQATTVLGGSSFPNATEIGPGSYSSTVVPGEALLFSFPLEYGQAARVSVTYPEASAAHKSAFGYFPPLSKIVLYNPMQAAFDEPGGAKVSSQVGNKDVTLVTATAPVSRSLISKGTVNGTTDYSMAGDYYLAISLERQDDYSLEFPLTISLEVVGEPQTGPTYGNDATWSVADGASDLGGDSDETPTEEPSSDATTSEPADPTDPADDDAEAGDDDGSGSALGLVAGGAGLIAVVGALLLWRRRAASGTP